VRDPIPGDLLALAPPGESLDEGDELPAKGTAGGFRDRSELDVGADRVAMGRTDSSWGRRDLAGGGGKLVGGGGAGRWRINSGGRRGWARTGS
jgi:hypothetical protein